jgi:phosphoglycolate phosphatase-like HAD superfamily hydrolase
MSDNQLRTAVERLDSALARVEAALAGSTPGAKSQGAALAALKQRHAALRLVVSDSVRELDTLLAVAKAAPPADEGR